MFVTYFYGCWWLPAMLTLLDFDVVKLGKDDAETRKCDHDVRKVIDRGSDDSNRLVTATEDSSIKAGETSAVSPEQDDGSCRSHPYEQVEV